MTVAWSDLGGALIAGLIWLGVIAAVLAVLAWDARRRRVPSIIIDVTGAVARMYVVIIALGAVVSLVVLFAGPTVSLDRFPVQLEWPETLPCSGASGTGPDGPALYCARVMSASAEVTGLSAGTMALLFVGGLLGYVTAAAPGILVAVLCGRAAAGNPFTPRASSWLLSSAVTVLIAGTLSEVLLAIARFSAAREILPGDGEPSAVTARATFEMVLPIWPLGAALVLAALAAIFRYGSRLQRDTEGLV